MDRSVQINRGLRLNGRRDLFKAGLASASLFLPLPYAWVWGQSQSGSAASSGTMQLLRAPKLALVVGNSGYARSPLKNPVNDARAMAEALKRAGFEVTVKLDVSRNDMMGALQDYARLLAKYRAVGLFYFAGHGLQLAWRNYMVPVDANVTASADIPAQCVEVGALLSGIAEARNPMNVIIMDACRDNPFGTLSGLDQKGLSQMDAPPSTLLAYATAPGNVAGDGDGLNGIYTEHLLKEITVPEARVEDVFKRVRLNVRRRTNGRQIPWESTSLEEDFYFVPPKELKRISDLEAQRQFEQDLALWEKIKYAKDRDALEDYLRRYPSGRFSELAQSYLDRVLAAQGEKKVEIVSDSNNPYSSGTVRTDTAFKVGDTFIWRRMDALTGLENPNPIKIRVTQITDHEVVYNKGGATTDLLGNPLRAEFGVYTANQIIPSAFVLGRQWNTQFYWTSRAGTRTSVSLDFRITAREKIVVPAGGFNAFRVEARGWQIRPDGNQSWYRKAWYAPDVVRREIAYEWLNRDSRGNIVSALRRELVEFHQT